jgi:Cysteine-rich secretory protein family
VLGGAAVPASADTSTPTPAPSAGALEADLLTKLNAERAAAGLGALALHPWASSVARAHSLEMARGRDIWHNHTGYLDIAKQAIGAYLTGENVAEAGTLDEADTLLMHSPPHRANILYPAFTSVGIGVALDTVGYVYVTQDFVTIRSAPAAPTRKAPGATAVASPTSAPVPAVPRRAAVTAAPAGPPAPGVATPVPGIATPVPQLGALAASPVAANRPVVSRRLSRRLGPSLPAAVWAIALAALAGVVYASVIRGRRSTS